MHLVSSFVWCYANSKRWKPFVGSLFHSHPHLLSFSKKKKNNPQVPVESGMCCPCFQSLKYLLGGFFSRLWWEQAESVPSNRAGNLPRSEVAGCSPNYLQSAALPLQAWLRLPAEMQHERWLLVGSAVSSLAALPAWHVLVLGLPSFAPVFLAASASLCCTLVAFGCPKSFSTEGAAIFLGVTPRGVVCPTVRERFRLLGDASV